MLFNLISSFIILVILAWVGVPSTPPVVGSVEPQTAVSAGVWEESTGSQLGLREGDRIQTIGGQEVYEFTDITLKLLDHGTGPLKVTVLRDGETVTLPTEGEVLPVYDHTYGFRTLGTLRLVERSPALLAAAMAKSLLEQS